MYRIAQDIEIVRELLGLTTEEMAKELGVSKGCGDIKKDSKREMIENGAIA